MGVTLSPNSVLRRQGLLDSIWCLDPAGSLGSGQTAALDGVLRTYPHLTDDEFIRDHRTDWNG
jgi:hypothetical protein